jgi:hypothetical protein
MVSTIDMASNIDMASTIATMASTIATMAGSTEDTASLTPITRSSFISPDHQKIAAENSSMFVYAEDGQGVEEVSTPVSVRESGIIPEGFCVGKALIFRLALCSESEPHALHRLHFGP